MFTVGGLIVFFNSIWSLVGRSVEKYFTYSLLVFSVISANLQIGYIISFGDNFVSIADYLLVQSAIIGLILLFRNAGSAALGKLILVFFLLLLVGIVYQYLRPHEQLLVPSGTSWIDFLNGQAPGEEPKIQPLTFIYLFRFACFFVICQAISGLKNFDIYLFLKNYIYFSTPFIIITVVEFFLKLFFSTNIILEIGNYIFGKSGAQLSFLLERGGIFALQGLTLEPNFLSQSLFTYALVAHKIDAKKRVINFFYGASVFLLVLAGSFQGIALVVIFFLMTITRKNLLANLIKIGFAGSFALIFFAGSISGIYEYYSGRINELLMAFADYNSIYNLSNYSSELVRIVSIIENINLAVHNPIFGVGLGSTYAYGFFPSLLSNIGIISSFLWVCIMLVTLKLMHRKVGIIVFALLCISFLFMGNMHTGYYMSTLVAFFAISQKVSANKHFQIG
jgi:hypothetical protein